MRAGPTPLASNDSKLPGSQPWPQSRLNVRNVSRWPAASHGASRGARGSLLTRQAAALPTECTAGNSSGLRRVDLGRSAASGDSSLSEHRCSATDAAGDSPAGSLAWREGVTDQALVQSTSDSEAGAGAGSSSSRGPSGGPRGRLHSPTHAQRHLNGHSNGSHTDKTLRTRSSNSSSSSRCLSDGPQQPTDLPGPETQGMCLNHALAFPGRNQHMGAVVVDLSTSVSRWLGGSSGTLRDWLRTTLLQPQPQDGEEQSQLQQGGGVETGSEQGQKRPRDMEAATAAAAGSNAPTPQLGVRSAGDAPQAGQSEHHGLASLDTAGAHALEPHLEEDSEAEEAVAAAGGEEGKGQSVEGSTLLLEADEAERWGSAVAASVLAASTGQALKGLGVGGDPRIDVALAPPPVRRRPVVAATPSSTSSGAAAASSSSAPPAASASSALPLRAAEGGWLSAPCLTAELGRAEDWRRLAALVAEHGARLDAIHVSAALVRLAKLCRSDPASLLAEAAVGTAAVGTAAGGSSKSSGSNKNSNISNNSCVKGGRRSGGVKAGQRRRGRRRAAAGEDVVTAAGVGGERLHPDVGRLVEALLARVPGLMPRAGHRSVSNMLWALGVLAPLLRTLPHASTLPASAASSSRPCARSAAALRGDAAQLSTAAAATAAAAAAAMAAAAAGPLRRLPPVVATVGSLLVAKMRHFWLQAGPHSLALSLWGMARLGLRPGPVWVAEFEAASAPLLAARRYSARQLSYSLWALAAMRLRPDSYWVSAARGALTAAAGSAAAAAVPRSSSACATCEPSTQGTSQEAEAVDVLTAQTLATMLWACTVLSVRLDAPGEAAVMAALTARLEQEGGRAGAHALSMALWGVVRLGMLPRRELLVAWRDAASGPALAGAPARSLSVMLWSLSALRSAPPGGWVDEAAAALLARAGEGALGRQALCNAVCSMGRLDVRVTAAWLLQFSAAAAPLLRELSPSELGVVLHGLGRLAGGDGAGGVDGISGAAGRRGEVAPSFLAAADAAAVVALPSASPDDLAGIGGGLRVLGLGFGRGLSRNGGGGSAAAGAVAASNKLQLAFARRTTQLLLGEGALQPRHSAECLASLAAFCGPIKWRPVAAEEGFAADAMTTEVSAAHRRWLHDPSGAASAVPSRAQTPIPPGPLGRLVLALVRHVVTSDLDRHDVFDVGQALVAAADLGFRPQTVASRHAVVSAAARSAGQTPGARATLRLLRGLRRLRVAPPRRWLFHVASQVGGGLRWLAADEVEELLRLLGSVVATPAAVSANSGGVAPATSPVTFLLKAAQPALANAPIQHLLDLASTLVAVTTGTTAPSTSSSNSSSPPAAPSPCSSPSDSAASPHPALSQPLSAVLPASWLSSFEAATAPKLSQKCVSVASLVQLLASMACLERTPAPAWAAAWYDSTERRLTKLAPQHLIVALRLQRRLGLAPPLAWLHAAAVAVAAVAERRELPSVEVLAAVAELQRLGLDDASMLAAAAAEALVMAPPPSLSSLVAAAATQLHAEMVVAEPPAQLATLAVLQALAEPWQPSDPRVAGPAPAAAAEGWAVGVLAMAHSVIAQRPLHQLLAGLQPMAPLPTAAPSSTSPLAEESGLEDADVAVGHISLPVAVPTTAVTASASLVLLLASMASWGHAPGARWLAGVARYVCRAMEARDGDDGALGGGGAAAVSWLAADAARVVCCLAAMDYVPAADVAERLQRQLTPALAAAELPPALAAELCGAWAAMRRRPPPAWWRAAESGSLAAADLMALAPLALVRLPYSMVVLGHVPSQPWLESYLQVLPHRLALLSLPAVADGSSSTCVGGCSGEDLSNLAWALGSAVHDGGYPPAVLSATGALQALLAAARPSLPGMGPIQLVLLVEGLARGRHRLPPPFVEALTSQAARQLQACGPSDLVSLLYCLAFLDARPTRAWLGAVLQRAAQLLPALLMCAEEAYRADDLAWAVAELDPGSGGGAGGGSGGGDLARPFLALLKRQRAALAAAAAVASERAAREHGGGGEGSGDGSSASGVLAGGGGRRRRSSPPRRNGGVGGAGVALEEAAVALQLPSISSVGAGGGSGGGGCSLQLWRGRGVVGGSRIRFRLQASSPSSTSTAPLRRG